jgi:DNA modification methylase
MGSNWGMPHESDWDETGVRLMMGDCLERMADIEDGSVDLIAADLPYQVTACQWDVLIPFAPLWAHFRRLLRPRGAVVLTASQPFTSLVVMSNPGWFRYELLWIKEQGTGNLNANKMPLRQHENILVFYDSLPTYRPQMATGSARRRIKPRIENPIFGKTGTKDGYVQDNVGQRYPTSLIYCTRDLRNGHRWHPTQKPVALFEYLIRTYTDEGETVLDPTMGSGTTGVACVNTGRKFIGIERDPAYFAIARDRIAELTRPFALQG